MPRLVTLATAGLVTPAFLHAAQRARRLLRRLPLCRGAAQGYRRPPRLFTNHTSGFIRAHHIVVPR